MAAIGTVTGSTYKVTSGRWLLTAHLNSEQNRVEKIVGLDGRNPSLIDITKTDMADYNEATALINTWVQTLLT